METIKKRKRIKKSYEKVLLKFNHQESTQQKTQKTTEQV
jgi:hypothetical protein